MTAMFIAPFTSIRFSSKSGYGVVRWASAGTVEVVSTDAVLLYCTGTGFCTEDATDDPMRVGALHCSTIFHCSFQMLHA